MAPRPDQFAGESSRKRISKALESLPSDRKPFVLKRAKDTPISARPGYYRATLGLTSPRMAIKAFCLECIGWDRAEITNCTSFACPLYLYRPYQKRRIEQRKQVMD